MKIGQENDFQLFEYKSENGKRGKVEMKIKVGLTKDFTFQSWTKNFVGRKTE